MQKHIFVSYDDWRLSRVISCKNTHFRHPKIQTVYNRRSWRKNERPMSMAALTEQRN